MAERLCQLQLTCLGKNETGESLSESVFTEVVGNVKVESEQKLLLDFQVSAPKITIQCRDGDVGDKNTTESFESPATKFWNSLRNHESQVQRKSINSGREKS